MRQKKTEWFFVLADVCANIALLGAIDTKRKI